MRTYRHVSLTSVAVKMTKQILEAISAQMSETKVSKNSQCELIKVKWCLTNLISFSAKQDQSLEKVRANSVVYIDFSRACDMISHNNPVLSKALLWLADWRKRFWLAVPGGWPGRAALAGCPGNIIRLASWGKSIWLAGLKGFGWLAGWSWESLTGWYEMLWLVDRDICSGCSTRFERLWLAGWVNWSGWLAWTENLWLSGWLEKEALAGWVKKWALAGWLAGVSCSGWLTR